MFDERLEDEGVESAESFRPEDTPDGEMTLAEYRHILEELDQQPRAWRAVADKEMDYADGNQLDTDLLVAMRKIGVPPSMENVISATLGGMRGYEENTRTDWRVTPNGQPGGQDVADAISFKLNEAERHSHADDACSQAFYPQIAVGIGWVEVNRSDDPYAYPFRCQAVHRNEIHWDWHAQRDDLSDARWLLRQRWLHPSRLMRIFPEHKELIRRFGKYGISWWSEFPAFPAEVSGAGGSTGLQRAWEEARDWTVMEDRWHNPMSAEVCVAELWYRRWVNAVVLKSPDGRVVEYDEGNPAHVYAVAQGLVKTMKVTVPRVRRSFWLGPHKLFDGATPFTHRWFPYVPFWGFREDTSRVPYGYVRDMVYLQDTLNIGLSRLRWGMSAYRVERTEGAVDMPDDLFREQVSRLDADVVLNAAHMAQPGARFEVKRDFQLNQQQMAILQGAREAIERVNPAGSAAFSGRRGTATSGSQESTQVEQANQALAHMMGNFRRGRTLVGEQLMALIIQEMGDKQETVVIEGDAVRADRTVILNKPETDPQTGQPYLSNDLLRTRLMVALEDVPSTHSYRAQQLAAMSEAVKSLPAQYQAAALPFMASLMDVPFKREMVEALRAASQQETPEQIEQRIQQAIEDDRQKQRSDLKERELDIKDKLADAEVKRLMAQAVQTGVQAAFSAMQGGAQVAMNPQIAPIADAIMQGAGYQKPSPGGADPDIPVPQGAQVAPVAPPQMSFAASAEDSSVVGAEQGAAPAPQGGVQGDVAAVRQNTSPAFPPVPQQPEAGMDGIETMQTADNLPA